MSVEEEEPRSAPGCRAVQAVQPGDAIGGEGQQVFVVGKGLAGGITPVGEDGEAHMPLGVGEIMSLDLIELLADALGACQHRRYDQHGPELGRYAVAQVELGQPARTQELGHVSMHDGDGEVGRWDEGEKREHDDGHPALAQERHIGEQKREEKRCDYRDRAEIARRRQRKEPATEPAPEGRPIPDLPFERPAAIVDQPVAEVLLAISSRILRPLREVRSPIEKLFRDLDLRLAGATRELLDRVSVAVARHEVQPRIDARFVPSKGSLNQADILEQGLPVETGHLAHARDDVGHGRMRRELARMLCAHQLVGRGSVFREPPFEPSDDRARCGIAVAKSLDDLHDERPFERTRLVGLQIAEDIHGSLDFGEQAIGENSRARPRPARLDDSLCQAAQVLDQDEA